MIAVGLAVHAVVLRLHSAKESRVFTISFAGHVVSGLLQMWLVLYYFPGGDMLGYLQDGVVIADILKRDVVEWFPEVVAVIFQQPDRLPIDFYRAGTTGSMSALSSFIMLAVGDSQYAACQLVALAAYLSQVMVFRALKPWVSPSLHGELLIGVMALPSAIFWSSALLKEPIVFCALGPLVLALSWLAAGTKRVQALMLGLPAVVVISVIKPYVLIALSVAAGFFYLLTRARAQVASLRPFVLISASAIIAGGIFLASRYFTKGDGASAAETLANQRRSGYSVEGGSNYFLDSAGGEETTRSWTQEVVLAPLALFTALYRPLLVEARNVVQLLNALEATVLLVLTFQILRRKGFASVRQQVLDSPVLVCCLVFVLSLALGTGLATSNLGTLSRYRAPMMPFFFTLLLLLRATPKVVDMHRATHTAPSAARRSADEAPQYSSSPRDVSGERRAM